MKLTIDEFKEKEEPKVRLFLESRDDAVALKAEKEGSDSVKTLLVFYSNGSVISCGGIGADLGFEVGEDDALNICPSNIW